MRERKACPACQSSSPMLRPCVLRVKLLRSCVLHVNLMFRPIYTQAQPVPVPMPHVLIERLALWPQHYETEIHVANTATRFGHAMSTVTRKWKACPPRQSSSPMLRSCSGEEKESTSTCQWSSPMLRWSCSCEALHRVQTKHVRKRHFDALTDGNFPKVYVD